MIDGWAKFKSFFNVVLMVAWSCCIKIDRAGVLVLMK